MRGKQDHLAESDHPVIKGGDRFEIQVVGRLIKYKHIGAGQHHARQHAANPLAAGEDGSFFHRFFARKKHSSEEAARKSFTFRRR